MEEADGTAQVTPQSAVPPYAFTFAVRWPDGTGQTDWHDLAGLREALSDLDHVLEALAPGESITVKRVR